MDQGRMRATVALLLCAEERLRIHAQLQGIDAALTRLERSPDRSSLHRRAIKKLGLLIAKLTKFEGSLTGSQRKSLLELKALHFFSAAFLAKTLDCIEPFPPVVATARGNFEVFIRERAHFLSVLQVLQGQFDAQQDYSMLSTATIAF